MSEVKKISRGDFWMLDADEAWSHVNAIQKELDRIGRVGHGMVERIIRVEGRDGNSLEAHYQDGRSQVFDFVDGEWAPHPVPKAWERTKGQLCLAWVKWAEKNSTSAWIPEMELATRLANGEKLDDLCRAANISLTVTEE